MPYDQYSGRWELEEREESAPPVLKFTVYHACGHKRTLRFDPTSEAGEAFVQMVEGSICRECRKLQRVGRAS
jgi:hypothetical protein